MRKPSAAFVVEVDEDADVAGGKLRGRVEHVVSGLSLDFGSADSLVSFIQQVLQPPAIGDETGQ